MTATELKQYWKAAPFVPFNILLPGGKKLAVPHPEFLSVSPSGCIAEVWHADDRRTSVDVFLITGLEQAPRGRGKAKRAGEK